MPQFVQDVEEIRQRAIRKIEEGPVTDAYRGDKDHTIAILNEALATEIVCVLRYLHHYFMATGVHGKAVADEFKEHADAERVHADQIAERIQQLGGKPDMDPGTLVARSATQYREGESLADMIREDLIAERVVIEVYNDMVRHFGNNDPTTRVMIEGILKDEEEHASDLADLLYVVDPHSGETEGQDPGSDPLKMEGRNSGRGQQQPGNQRSRGNQQGREPTFRQPQPGRAFAGEDRPNPPGPAGSAALEGRQQTEQFAGRAGAQGNRGRRGRRGRRAA